MSRRAARVPSQDLTQNCKPFYRLAVNQSGRKPQVVRRPSPTSRGPRAARQDDSPSSAASVSPSRRPPRRGGPSRRAARRSWPPFPLPPGRVRRPGVRYVAFRPCGARSRPAEARPPAAPDRRGDRGSTGRRAARGSRRGPAAAVSPARSSRASRRAASLAPPSAARSRSAPRNARASAPSNATSASSSASRASSSGWTRRAATIRASREDEPPENSEERASSGLARAVSRGETGAGGAPRPRGTKGVRSPGHRRGPRRRPAGGWCVVGAQGAQAGLDLVAVVALQGLVADAADDLAQAMGEAARAPACRPGSSRSRATTGRRRGAWRRRAPGRWRSGHQCATGRPDPGPRASGRSAGIFPAAAPAMPRRGRGRRRAGPPRRRRSTGSARRPCARAGRAGPR